MIRGLDNLDGWEAPLSRALEFATDGSTLEGWKAAVERGELKAFEIDGQAVALLGLEGDSCHAYALAGRGLQEFAPEMIDGWKAVAREQGCRRLTLTGRPGCQRVYKPHGGVVKMVLMEFTL